MKCSKVSIGKFYYVFETLFSGTSKNYESHDRRNNSLINDFPEFDGQLNIEEFLDWLIKWRDSLKIEI